MSSNSTGRRSVLIAGGAAIASAMIDRPLLASEPSCRLFGGKYRYKGGDKERQGRDDAIEAVVKQMNVLVRAIARGKLKDANPIAETIVISDDGKQITTVFDKRSYTAPIDGGVVKVKGITGDDMELHFEISKGTMFEFFRGDDKGRVNGFYFDGDDLKLRARVYSSKLPSDVVFTLTYEKV